MRVICLVVFLLAFSNTSISQKVKLKKGIVYVDKIALFSYEKKSQGTEFVVYELNTKNQLFIAVFNRGDRENQNDDYYRLLFPREDKMMEYSANYWNKHLIGWLLEQNVLSNSGEINESEIDIFIKKYDEKLTERTIRVQ